MSAIVTVLAAIGVLNIVGMLALAVVIWHEGRACRSRSPFESSLPGAKWAAGDE